MSVYPALSYPLRSVTEIKGLSGIIYTFSYSFGLLFKLMQQQFKQKCTEPKIYQPLSYPFASLFLYKLLNLYLIQFDIG